MALRASNLDILWYGPIAGERAIGKVARTAAGSLQVCIERGDSQAGSECWVECPSTLDPEGASKALSLWPAWRVVDAARLELGSRLVVVGDGGLADSVTVVSRAVGVAWCVGLTTEVLLLAPPTRQLPARPDTAILLSGDTVTLDRAARLCRDKGALIVAASGMGGGFNFYQDLHRRSLVLRALDPVLLDFSHQAAWGRIAPWLARLDT